MQRFNPKKEKAARRKNRVYATIVHGSTTLVNADRLEANNVAYARFNANK